ncbi:MAG TPA: glycine cleavage system aminomethyltransferase GcvT, partial [Deltaproteobacteria bacterium]|nr:glycine cleavage system aminomethyltransferase GcvT [Deltaproteobacteria bacterium]
MTDLRRTPLFQAHVDAGARMVDFGGWEMPVQYTSMMAEHRQVRERVGLFDVSHMGEVRVRGAKALAAVRHLVTNQVDIVDGQAQYTAMCNERGGIIDDLIVYRIAEDDILVCVNAGNREKDFAWMVENNPFKGEVDITDEGDQWGQIAVQGRLAEATLQALTNIPLDTMRYYWHGGGTVAGVDGCLVARTGYTGEDGFEVFVPADVTRTVWDGLLDAGAAHGVSPIGLAARDTLRLEARMCLYGNDITEQTTPLEAGLRWVTKLDKPNFIGKAALLAQKEAGLTRRLVGLVVEKRIARHGHAVLVEGEVRGEVTSGTRSPTRGDNIALAYVPRSHARPGSE